MTVLDWMTNQGQERLKELSIDQRLSKIRYAINDHFSKPSPSVFGYNSGPQPVSSDCWVKELYPGYAIVEKANENYRVDYTVNGDGTVTVSDEMIPVEMVWVPKETRGEAASPERQM